MMAAMDAKIKAATDAVEAKLSARLAELDALKAEKQARDAHATAQQDAELRRLGAFHGVRDAGTLAMPALVSALGERLNLAIDGTGDPRPFVQGTAARRAASMGSILPVVAYDATQDADLKPNMTEVQ
jgi:regulator of protease activity HflC (stomatin/prohibitin superfamily)